MSEAGGELNKAQRQRDAALASERAARELAERHSRAKDVFLATLSHELRNPLAPILTASGVLLLPSATPTQREKSAQVIGRQASTMSHLLDDLLDVSRITTGRVLLNVQAVRVGDVVDAAVAAVKPLLEERRHQLTIQVDPRLAVRGDRIRLIQVVSNLLNNAAKYTDVEGHIQVTASGAEDQVVIAVADDGIGIPPSALRQVFKIFSQLEEQRERSRGGLGIGLSLVKGIVELHGAACRCRARGRAEVRASRYGWLGRRPEKITRVVKQPQGPTRPAVSASFLSTTRWTTSSPCSFCWKPVVSSTWRCGTPLERPWTQQHRPARYGWLSACAASQAHE